MRSLDNRADSDIDGRGVLPGDADPSTYLTDGALGNFESKMPEKKDEPGNNYLCPNDSIPLRL